jgi:hypothetical protein
MRNDSQRLDVFASLEGGYVLLGEYALVVLDVQRLYTLDHFADARVRIASRRKYELQNAQLGLH